jgi:hypothetical protein
MSSARLVQGSRKLAHHLLYVWTGLARLQLKLFSLMDRLCRGPIRYAKIKMMLAWSGHRGFRYFGNAGWQVVSILRGERRRCAYRPYLHT